MIEEIDTNSDYANKVIPDGPHHCKVVQTRKIKTGSFAWTLDYEDGQGEILMFPNQMGDLLKALGCAEGDKPGKYVLNTDITTGGEFDAVFYTNEKGYKSMKDVKGSGVGY